MRRKTTSEFIIELSNINPNIEVLGQYEGAYTPVQCRCIKCNHVWMAVPHNILTKSGCPNCSHSATSFIEQFILLSLQEALGSKNVLTRDKKTIGKELDIYIPYLNVAIEPGAWYYHKNSAKKDEIKRRLCDEKGIRLITIYYGCDNENEFASLINLVKKIFFLLEIHQQYSNELWQKLKAQAYLDSRKSTTEEFAEKLREIYPKITLLGLDSTSLKATPAFER